MATTPAYASGPLGPPVQISTGNSNRDGTGTGIVDVVTPGSNGCVIEDITIKATVTTTAGMIRLFIYNATAAAYRLWREIPVPATSAPSATVPAWEIRFPINLKLVSGAKFAAATEKSEAFNITANGGQI